MSTCIRKEYAALQRKLDANSREFNRLTQRKVRMKNKLRRAEKEKAILVNRN